MHLPLSIQYFVIGANDHQMVDFFDAMNAIYNNYGIRIIVTLYTPYIQNIFIYISLSLTYI